jgi:hypothetical protein
MADLSNVTSGADPDLRDFFAGKALPMVIDIGHDEGWSADQIATAAFIHADAMLAARSSSGSKEAG